MRQLQPVLWTKGVLLSPQHLQTQDRYLEDLLAVQLSALAFHPWGFSRLALDRDQLAGGVVKVTDAAGIFPDGLLFDVPGADAPPPHRSLQDAFAPGREWLDLFLALPEYRRGQHSIGAGTGNGTTRYVAELVDRRDEVTGYGEKPIQVVRRNFRLLFEGEPQEGYAVLPLARVRRTTSGAFLYDQDFVPPLLDVGASERLMGLARRLLEILAARSGALAAMRRQKNRGLADFGVTDVANFWLLYTIDTHLPVVRHLFETRRGHPAGLYEALVALAGALTTFSDEIRPGDLPAYAHDRLGDCFATLDAQLRRLLETVVPAYCISIPLERTEVPTIHAASIEQDRYLQGPQIFLAVRADESAPGDLARRGPQLLKVGAVSTVREHLVNKALPGLPLTHVPRPPGEVPLKLDHQYFVMERLGPEWEAITRARNVAVHVPADFPNPHLELVIVLPRAR